MRDWVIETGDLDWKGDEEEAVRPTPPTPWERLALLGLKTAYKEFKARPHWYYGFGVAMGDTPWAVMAEDWRIIENTVCMAMDEEAERMGNVGEDEWPDVMGITLYAVEAFLGRSYPRHAPQSMAVATWGVVSKLTAARVLYERERAIRQTFGELLTQARTEGRLGPAVDPENGSWLIRH
jgi:hypothetical protein